VLTSEADQGEVGEDHNRRVAVIGAGIAGLVTAKVLRDDGFDVTVFEKEPEIGGVWAESRTYPGLRTNNSRNTYGFSDHPYDESADVFPTAEQVRVYLASYASRFELAPLIRLSTEVTRVSRQDDGFEVAFRGVDGADASHFDFAVVCVGTFSEPYVPEIAGSERFEGTVVHSSQATDRELFAGKRVVVVGAGKSALDCAAWAAEHAKSCTLVFRAPHWMVPRFLPGGIPADRVVLTRLTMMLVRYHRLSRFERFLHGPARIIPRLFWRANGGAFRRVMKVPPAMVPDHQLPLGIETVGVAPEFFELAHRGEVEMRRAAISSFTGVDELLLTNGDRICADTVIFATGWRQAFDFLAPDLQAAVLRDGHLQLYRHVLPPAEQCLGFVGYASSVACQLNAEISAHWLSQHFRGELTTPTVDDMNREIERVGAWLVEVLPAHPQGHLIGPYVAQHIDELMDDMGLPRRRTRNVLSEYFGQFSPARYCHVAEERRRHRRAPVGAGSR
jgi:cation diffusion facilitator CzcD-associated flavoprotein CzcO